MQNYLELTKSYKQKKFFLKNRYKNGIFDKSCYETNLQYFTGKIAVCNAFSTISRVMPEIRQQQIKLLPFEYMFQFTKSIVRRFLQKLMKISIF